MIAAAIQEVSGGNYAFGVKNTYFMKPCLLTGRRQDIPEIWRRKSYSL
jgi:hypothetical protein